MFHIVKTALSYDWKQNWTVVEMFASFLLPPEDARALPGIVQVLAPRGCKCRLTCPLRQLIHSFFRTYIICDSDFRFQFSHEHYKGW